MQFYKYLIRISRITSILISAIVCNFEFFINKIKKESVLFNSLLFFTLIVYQNIMYNRATIIQTITALVLNEGPVLNNALERTMPFSLMAPLLSM